MKILIQAFLASLLFVSGVQAQQSVPPTEERRQEPGQDKVLDGSTMPKMQTNQQELMMQDMVQVMADIVKVQQQIVEKMKTAGKRELQSQLSDLSARVNTLIAGMKGMTSQAGLPRGMNGQSAAGGTATRTESSRESGDIRAPRIQEKTDAGVSAKVALESANGTLVFRVALDSETVNVDQYRFGENILLRAGDREYAARPRSEDGTSHHRSAILEFQNPGTREYQIVIKGASGVTERVFSFPF